MWTSKQSSNRQTGFTLVELAIVLVIIGLILGAVLKGQQMIENGRVKSVENDLKGVSTAYYAYLDRYKAIPGDDLLATTHVSSATVTAALGDGNGTRFFAINEAFHMQLLELAGKPLAHPGRDRPAQGHEAQSPFVAVQRRPAWPESLDEHRR